VSSMGADASPPERVKHLHDFCINRIHGTVAVKSDPPNPTDG
jgi:hypothetical protein